MKSKKNQISVFYSTNRLRNLHFRLIKHTIGNYTIPLLRAR